MSPDQKTAQQVMNHFSAKKISTCTSSTSEDDLKPLKPSFEAAEVCLRIKPKGHLGYRHSVSLTERGSIVLKSNPSLQQEGEAGKTNIG